MTTSTLWYSAELQSMERCTLREPSSGLQQIEGTVLTLINASATEIRYTVICNREWHTRRCTVDTFADGPSRTVELEADDSGRWRLNGQADHRFDGVIDMDLGFSPCTNTLPIRRLGLGIGASARIDVAWLRFPEFDVVRAEQVYTRLAEKRYRFETGSGDFRADLEVGERGLVISYGNLWRVVGP